MIKVNYNPQSDVNNALIYLYYSSEDSDADGLHQDYSSDDSTDLHTSGSTPL